MVRAERAAASSPEVEAATDVVRPVALVLPAFRGYTINPALVLVSLDGSRSRVPVDWVALNRYSLSVIADGQRLAALPGTDVDVAPALPSRSAPRAPPAALRGAAWRP